MAGTEAGPMFFRSPLSGRGLAAARGVGLVGGGPTLALTAFGFSVGLADLTILAPESVFVALAEAGIDPAVGVVVGLVLPLVLITAIAALVFWGGPAGPPGVLPAL